MQKAKLIIVEGPQGTGKTTLTNYLRDNIAGSNLYRLSGQKIKTPEGKEYSKKMYYALIEYLNAMQSIPMDIIFDRTFFTEEVYARLGYKEYSFTDVYKNLINELLSLNYDSYYFSLYLDNVELYKERLKRDSHHNYQAFSIQNSINQQKIYQDLYNEIKEENINCYEIPMDNPEEAYNNIQKILKLF